MCVSMSSKYLPVANPVDSFWLSEPDVLRDCRTTKSLPAEVDVVVVGSGYAGTATCHFLYEDNPEPPSILMLEARDVCSGATARNGGHLKPDIYRAHIAHKSKYGEKGAAEIANFEHAHLAAFKELIEKEDIKCDFILTRACDVQMTPKTTKAVLENYHSMMQNPYITCKKDIQLLEGETAKTVSKVEASDTAITYTAGQMWPYKFICHLLKKCISKGLNLQTTTPVLGTERVGDKWLVKTKRGNVLASKVVFATNAYTASVDESFENVIVPIKGACSRIVSADAKVRTPHLTNTYGIRFDGSDTDYLVNRGDGSVIVGGAKKHIFPYPQKFFNVVDDSFLIEKTDTYFDGYMQRHFYTWKNFNARTDIVWTGILGYTQDGLPFVGETDEKNKFIIAGFHGHGMPRILLSAKALAKSIRHSCSMSETDIPQPFIFSKERKSQENHLYSKLKPDVSKL